MLSPQSSRPPVAIETQSIYIHAMQSVAVLAIDGAVGFELAIPSQMLGAARSRTGDRLYDVRVCGGPRITATAAGEALFTLRPPHRLHDALDCDMIIVPASAIADRQPPAVLDLLRTAHSRGIQIASICTGAFVLAAAGLLNGRRVTTHWAYADELAAEFPQVEVDASVLFVDDGDVVTSAGVTSGIDLCIHLIRRDHGVDVANRVARNAVMPPHRDGGQAQFVRYRESIDADESLSEVLLWMRRNLDQPLRLDQIARRANMSTRTLVRRFPEQTGVTPLRWLRQERVRRAQHLLETTGLTIEDIAGRTGFRDGAGLRKHFARLVGVAPQSYRRAFR
jgi:transcriptional regulator GlxA family with amidase domain